MGHDCCRRKSLSGSKPSTVACSSQEHTARDSEEEQAIQTSNTSSFSSSSSSSSVCNVCSIPGPCADQGLCMDPTVIQTDSDSSFFYLIEGQAYAFNDSRWESRSLPSEFPAGCCVNGTPVPHAQFEQMGLDMEHRHGPDCGHDRVPHGDHFDYLVGSHLHHVPEICENNPLHERVHGQVLDHGEVIVVRKRCGERGHKYEPFYGTDALGDSDRTAAVEEIKLAVAIEQGANQSTVRTRLKVDGICCPSEVPLIHNVLDHIPGVRNVEVIVPTKVVLIDHVPRIASVTSLVDALNRASLAASIANDGTAANEDGDESIFGWLVSNLPPLNVMVSTLFFLASFLHYILYLHKFGEITCLVSIIFGAPPIILKAFGALRNRVLDVNTLMIFAAIGSVALGQYTEAAAIVVLFSISEWMTNKSFSKAQSSMTALLALRPESALLKSTMKEIPIESARVGDIVVVKPGCKVPLDGFVTEGVSTVDESALTGESIPVEKQLGSQVLAGTVNLSGYFEMEVSATSADSTVSRHARLVEEAQASRSRAELIIEQFARIYTPIVVISALVLPVAPCIYTDQCVSWIKLALVFLVVACPCSLVLSTPVVAVCGLARAARRGVLVKGSTYLEILGKMKTLCLDKTGTLTEGRFRITGCRLSQTAGTDKTEGGYGGPALGEGSLLRWACAVEHHSSHPVASAILESAGPSIRVAAERAIVTDYSTIPGVGVQANVDGRLVEVGNIKIAEKNRWIEKDTETAKQAALWEQEGATVIWVGIDGEHAGIIAAQDRLRDKAASAVKGIKALNIRPAIVTGDNEGSVKIVAGELGIVDADVHASLSPEDKLRILREYKQLQSTEDIEMGPMPMASGSAKNVITGMVGDGINDGPALAVADVGIAMGVAGTAVAMETADVALLTNDLTELVNVIHLARTCINKIRQNIAVSIVSKAIVMSLSIARVTGLWEAVLFDVGTAMLVVFNGMVLLRKSKNHACASKSNNHNHSTKTKKESSCSSGCCSGLQTRDLSNSSDDVNERATEPLLHQHIHHNEESYAYLSEPGCDEHDSAHEHGHTHARQTCIVEKIKSCNNKCRHSHHQKECDHSLKDQRSHSTSSFFSSESDSCCKKSEDPCTSGNGCKDNKGVSSQRRSASRGRGCSK